MPRGVSDFLTGGGGRGGDNKAAADAAAASSAAASSSSSSSIEATSIASLATPSPLPPPSPKGSNTMQLFVSKLKQPSSSSVRARAQKFVKDYGGKHVVAASGCDDVRVW